MTTNFPPKISKVLVAFYRHMNSVGMQQELFKSWGGNLLSIGGSLRLYVCDHPADANNS
jgi:hypothetical protein